MSYDITEDRDSKQLLDDLLVLSTLSTETIKALGDAVEQQPGFLSIENVVSAFFTESHRADPVERLILELSPVSVDSVLGMVDQWRGSDDRSKELMSDERFEVLRKNLSLLVRESPALDRTKKARALQTVTGNEVMGVMFVCDARPVYNKDRDDIEGYVALATMKVLYDRQNADTEEIEFVMTPEEIDLLIKRAVQARDKIKVLNQKLTSLLPNAISGGQS